MKKLNVVFMGTPTFAVPVLDKLIKETNVVLVVSQPDREKDRKGNVLNTPIKKLALENNIPVLQPDKLRNNVSDILNYKPDIIITCAYGQIVPEELLNYPRLGCINVHGSLLPKLRGGAPIHWAIINGYDVTGMTIMYMSKDLDAGDIISQETLKIEYDDTLENVYNKMSLLGSELLIKTLPSIIEGTNQRIRQDESLVTFGYNVKKEDEVIKFNKNAIDIYNLVRGLNPIPGAYCMLDNKRLKIYEIEILDSVSTGKLGVITDIVKDGLIVDTLDKKIKIKDIKLEGKKRCLVRDFLNGINDKKELVGKELK